MKQMNVHNNKQQTRTKHVTLVPERTSVF